MQPLSTSLFALWLALATGLGCSLHAQPIVTYLGADALYDVVQLSDGTHLLAGQAQDLAWLPAATVRVELGHPGISNANGTGRYAFLLHLSRDMTTALGCYHLPQGTAEDIRFIKVSNLPRAATAGVFISGNTRDTRNNGGGYFIGKLDGNFVDALPTALVWTANVWAEGDVKTNHPWDVDGLGRVVYARGQSHAYDWASVHRLDADGQPDLVPNWRIHWQPDGQEFRGTAAQHPQGAAGLDNSGLVLKTWGRCELRSHTWDEYLAVLPDGNGGTRQGTWPWDAFFDGPCDPNDPQNTGPGYTGYRLGATPVQSLSAIVCDRTTNTVYLGMNMKTVLPDGNPDFEPAVVAMDDTGSLLWWSRLYHERTPEGEPRNSSPDQYVDALAIDYTRGQLVVNARCHGNNVENLWEGDAIAANPQAAGFQNRFTGTSGDIHISWLGKLGLTDGILHHSTYVAEYAEAASGLGQPFTTPNLAGWPNPNTGWPTVNTTRLARNQCKTTADGSVLVAGVGRRTITTNDAYQRMVLPADGGLSAWNSFVRLYTPDLSSVAYSSLLVGQWDTLTQVGGGNTAIYGTWKSGQGVIAVGERTADAANPQLPAGYDLPLTGVPTWGKGTPNAGATAVLAYYPATSLANPDDDPVVAPNATDAAPSAVPLRGYPNPTGSVFWVEGLPTALPTTARSFVWVDLLGRPWAVPVESVADGMVRFDVANLPAGVYFLHTAAGAALGQSLRLLKL